MSHLELRRDDVVLDAMMDQSHFVQIEDGKRGARVTIAKTLMTSLQDRETLARVTLDAADALASRR